MASMETERVARTFPIDGKLVLNEPKYNFRPYLEWKCHCESWVFDNSSLHLLDGGFNFRVFSINSSDIEKSEDLWYFPIPPFSSGILEAQLYVTLALWTQTFPHNGDYCNIAVQVKDAVPLCFISQETENLDLSELEIDGEASRPKKRQRTDAPHEESDPKSTQCYRIRYIGVKELGNKLKDNDTRYKKIIQQAVPLPFKNQLVARRVYWFVATENIVAVIEDKTRFVLKKTHQFTHNGTVYYLHQICFVKNARGSFYFNFPDGRRETIECLLYKPPAEALKGANKPADGSDSDLPQFDEFFSSNNAEQSALTQNIPRLPSQEEQDTTQLGPPDIVNILALVPDTAEAIEMFQQALIELGFMKEASSGDQYLYSEKNLRRTKRHMLLLPYGKLSRYFKVYDHLEVASEAILFVENEREEINVNTHDLVAVARVRNILGSDTWDFTIKPTLLKSVEVDFNHLTESAKMLFIMQELQPIIGGVIYKRDILQLHNRMASFLAQWNMAPSRTTTKDIYLCFIYEPTVVQSFSEYATLSLNALGVKCETLVVHGSVRVYLRCPSYCHWYLTLRQEEILRALSEEGLKELRECFISDIEKSMLLPSNARYLNELIYWKECMIGGTEVADGTIGSEVSAEQLRDLFVANPDVIRQLIDDAEKVDECFAVDEAVVLLGDNFAAKVFPMGANNEPCAAFRREVSVRSQIQHPLFVPLRSSCDKKSVQIGYKTVIVSYLVMDRYKTSLERWLHDNYPLSSQTAIGFISDLFIIAHTLNKNQWPIERDDLVVREDQAHGIQLKSMPIRTVSTQQRGEAEMLLDLDVSILLILRHCKDMDTQHKEYIRKIPFSRTIERAHSQFMRRVVFDARSPFVEKYPFLDLDSIKDRRPGEPFEMMFISAMLKLPMDKSILNSLLTNFDKNLQLPTECLNLAHPNVPDSVYNGIIAKIESKQRVNGTTCMQQNDVILAIKKMDTDLMERYLICGFELTTRLHHSAMAQAWMKLQDSERAKYISDNNTEFWTSFSVHMGVQTADGYMIFVRHSQQQNREVSQISCGLSELLSVKDIKKDSSDVDFFHAAQRGLEEQFNIVLDKVDGKNIKFFGVGCEHSSMQHGIVGVVDLTGTQYTKDKLIALLSAPANQLATREPIFVPTEIKDVFDFIMQNGPSLAPGCFACAACCLYNKFGELETNFELFNYLRARVVSEEKEQ